jgi:DNA-binding NarL/FixJ family response regulator
MPTSYELKLKALIVLYKDGWSPEDIARVLLLSRSTVERTIVAYLRTNVAYR